MLSTFLGHYAQHLMIMGSSQCTAVRQDLNVRCWQAGKGHTAEEVFFDAEEEAWTDSPSCDSRRPQKAVEIEMAVLCDVPVEAVRKLSVMFPDSPPAECARYLARGSAAKCPQKAAVLLSTYLHDRAEKMPSLLKAQAPHGLPRMHRVNGNALDGSRIILCLPCVLEMKFSPEAYAHELIRLLGNHIPRESGMRITLLVDTRPHPGYEGNNAFWMCRHVALLVKTFQHYHPERLAKILVYPADPFALLAWGSIKPLLSAATKSKVELLAGREGGPLPTKLLDYVRISQIYEENQCFFASDGMAQSR